MERKVSVCPFPFGTRVFMHRNGVIREAEYRGMRIKDTGICGNNVDTEHIFWWDTDRACRRCSECGRLMRKGYCIDAGAAYYCSDECLHTDFTDEEWAEEYESNDQSYYTEWE